MGGVLTPRLEAPHLRMPHVYDMYKCTLVQVHFTSACTQNCKVEVTSYPGITFKDSAGVEAAAVTWLEVCEVNDEDTACFEIGFGWRPETIATFFESGGEARTNSSLQKVEYYNEGEDEWDILKFRLMLWPASSSTPTESGEECLGLLACQFVRM